jgi:serine/threonine protein kinase
VVGQKLSWVGLSVGDYVIKELLGEGSYSWVFRALHQDGATAKAIKVAKPPEAVAEGGPTSCVPTNALAISDDALTEFVPDTELLLCLQAKKLQEIDDPRMMAVEEMSQRPGGCYYRMPVVTGTTLRQYMNSGPVPIDVLLDIALGLDSLMENEAFGYHGDLKPENIMITPGGVVLIDPGYFGSMDVVKGHEKKSFPHCAVTTPMYYPRIEPDDLLALGLIMWELALRDHPLAKRFHSKDFDRKHYSDELWNQIIALEASGKHHLAGILSIKQPSQLRPGLPLEVEEVLLKALGLQFEFDGTLNIARRFKGFSELAAALARLLSKNIRYL